MTLTLALLALTLVSSFAFMIVNLVNAPEGYEDENGFHAKLSGQPVPVPVRVQVSDDRLAA